MVSTSMAPAVQLASSFSKPSWQGAVKMMSKNIAGKMVVITGASSRLGEATARLLSTQGVSVVLGARRGKALPHGETLT